MDPALTLAGPTPTVARAQRASHDTRPSAGIAGWAVLGLGTLRLALPQRDVREIDLVGDLQTPAAGDGLAIGARIRDDGRSWPAYCLDADLRFTPAVPALPRLCVFFGSADSVRGVLCDRVWSLAADGDLVVQPLPGCFGGERSPAIGLAQFKEEVAVVTDGNALAVYLAEIEEAEHGRDG